MEPLTALGVASNVVQFVDFAGKIISQTIQIHRAKGKGNGADDHWDLQIITQDFHNHNKSLKISLEQEIPQQTSLSVADREIVQICEDCAQITTRLLNALSKLRSSRVNLWTSFVDALRTVWSEDDIQKLTKTLDSYRQQISLYLLASLRDELRAFQRCQSGRDANLLTTVEQTRNEVTNFFSKVAQKQLWQQGVTQAIHDDYERRERKNTDLQSLPAVSMQKGLGKEDFQHFQEGLLQWLRFTELERRHEKISLAYEQTFEWIFQSPPEDQWSDFVKWLESDADPLYWITGKPAAGKSTLMKFIYTDPRTTEHLGRWAQGKKSIVSAFYFWNSGTQMQMSTEGMARTLLYETVRQAPELWAIVFPQKMEEYVVFGSPWREPITWDEMMRAFRLLVEGTGEEYKLFFFIDGLDEFDGAHEKQAVERFRDGFQQRPSLRLEDLTFRDIKHFVSSRFNENRGFSQLRMLDPRYADQLINNITRKASGVFLWVTLVTDSLLDGLSDGERLEELQARLDSLPTDLETIFWKLLNRLGDKHLARTSELLQIIRASLTPLNLLTLSYADEPDPVNSTKVPMQIISIEQANARAEILRRRLNACCKGLIESKTTPGQELFDAPVGYLHRTVKDYVECEDVWSRFLDMTNETFSPYVRLCNAQIMILKISGGLDGNEEIFWDAINYTIEYATRADPGCLQGLQPKLLNDLNVAATYASALQDPRGEIIDKRLANLYRPIKIGVGTYLPRTIAHWSGAPRGPFSSTSFFDLAVQYQLTDYVRFVCSAEADSKPDTATLTYALLIAIFYSGSHLTVYNYRPSVSHWEPNPELIKFLLSFGADPNADIYGALEDGTEKHHSISPWEAYLNLSDPKFREMIGTILLDHGADPSMVNRGFNEEVYQCAQKKMKENRVSRWSKFRMVFRSKA